MDDDKYEWKLLDARDYIHRHPGQLASELPPRKVRPYLQALEARGLIKYEDVTQGWVCQCASCAGSREDCNAPVGNGYCGRAIGHRGNHAFVKAVRS